MPRVRRLVVSALGLSVAAFIVTTWVALEASGVGVVTTARADGEPRQTHVWPVEIEGALWLEAGTPDNGWYRDVQQHPRLTLERDGATATYVAVPVPTPEAHADLRAAIEAAYGWRARWVRIWVDPEGSVPVRLETPAGADVFGR